MLIQLPHTEIHPTIQPNPTYSSEALKPIYINLVVQCKSQSVGQWFIVSDLEIHSYRLSCVFVFLTVQNIIFDVLGPLAFRKYSTCWIFPALDHSVFLYLCTCVFVFVFLCICQSRISFLMSRDHWLFKNTSMLGISGTFLHAVFVYLCICVLCVFKYLTVQNIIFDVLGPLAFQKYSIIKVYEVYLAWWRTTDRTNNRVNLGQVRLWNSKKVWLLQKCPFYVCLYYKGTIST